MPLYAMLSQRAKHYALCRAMADAAAAVTIMPLPRAFDAEARYGHAMPQLILFFVTFDLLIFFRHTFSLFHAPLFFFFMMLMLLLRYFSPFFHLLHAIFAIIYLMPFQLLRFD